MVTKATTGTDYAMNMDAYTSKTDVSYTGYEGTGATGDSGTADTGPASNTENRPLYLSCFYIMRVK